MIVLENSPGSGFGLGIDVTELAGIFETAIAARGVPRRPARLLPRYRARLGGRHRRLRPRRHRCLPRRLRRSDRARATGDDPPQRLEVRARLAARPARAPRRRAGSARPACAICCAIRRLPTSPTTSRRPGMDEGYDAVNVARAYDIAAGRPLAELPPEAMELRGSRARSGPAPADDEATASDDRPRVDRHCRHRCPARAARPSRPCCGSRTSPRAGPGMPTRATTCSMLRALVRDGVVPLLGPPTSIGDVHHGALYYYLLCRPPRS